MKIKQMNARVYLEYIKDRNTENANQYKDIFIPKTLYKYYFLFDEKYSDHKKENKIRLKTLENNKLWLSVAENLNDPFELKGIFLNEQTLVEEGWDMGLIRMMLERTRNSMGISSFSNNFNSNMPMWAHYSNNHHGFCVEYQIEDSSQLYPVFYEKRRIKTVSTFPDVVTEIKNSLAGREITYNFEVLASRIFLDFCLKHVTWKYEQEYRILYPFTEQVEQGKLISNSSLNIYPKTIYLGVRCLDKHRKELKRIADKLDCAIDEMYFDESSTHFELKHRPYLG